MFSFGKFKMNFHGSPKERGQAIVLYAIGMVALIAVIGLATDAMMIYKTKQDLQRSVDSAALAGAYKLPHEEVAIQATSEFMRLHGYDRTPCGSAPDFPLLLGPCTKTQPYLEITFPHADVQKIVHVEASTDASYFFLRILGFNTMTVRATGEGEAAPMDVYLIFDLSESMTYDTFSRGRPSPWPSGFPSCTWADQSDCVAQYCNWAKGDPAGSPPVPPRDTNRICDPLDKSIKPAAYFFIDQLDPRYDRVGVVSYDQYGVKVIGLTSDFNGVKAKIGSMDAFDHQGGSASACPNTSPAGCNKQTNIGDGIMVAHTNIASEGRLDSIWSLILMTDGKANVYRSCSGCPPNCGASACNTLYLCNECSEADTWATDNASDAWDRHDLTIYTIAYGATSYDPDYQALMIEIAKLTDGVIRPPDISTDNFFKAPTGDDLKKDFYIIAQRIYARLLK